MFKSFHKTVSLTANETGAANRPFMPNLLTIPRFEGKINNPRSMDRALGMILFGLLGP
jgi:hypothetical protein